MSFVWPERTHFGAEQIQRGQVGSAKEPLKGRIERGEYGAVASTQTSSIAP